MQRLRMLTVVVLMLLGIGGLVGGAALLIDRTGGRLGMTVDQLPGWPLLTDYTVPGVVVLLLFGVLPLAAAWLVHRHSPIGWSLTTAVGVLLVLWMAVEIVTIGLGFPVVQAGLLIVGILIAGLGLDGGTLSRADEYDSADRSYAHADDER